jgi:AcrR family transcriptional regulator
VPRIQAPSIAEHKRLTEGRLLDAWATVVADRGYDGTSLSEVASQAGVARSAIYNYFPNKEALLLAWLGREVQRLVDRLDKELPALPTAEARLRHLVDAQVHHFAATPAAACEFQSAIDPAHHAGFVARVRPMHDLIRVVVNDGVTSGEFRPVDLDGATSLVAACLAAERVPLANGDADPEEVASRTAEFLVGALRA